MTVAAHMRPTTSSPLEALRSLWAPTVALGVRGLIRMRRRPSLMVPVIVTPLFFVITFGNSFEAVAELPGYADIGVTAWVLPWAALQGGAFAGVGASAMAAQDMQDGFFDRLLLAPVSRVVVLAGAVSYAVARSLIPLTLVIPLGYVLGVDFRGGVVGMAMMWIGGIGLAMVMSLLGLTLVYRLKTMKALAVVQMTIVVSTFLSIGQVPLAVMDGWLHTVARANPVTNILRMARQGMIGDVAWSTTWPGLVAIAGLVVGFGTTAWFTLRRVS